MLRALDLVAFFNFCPCLAFAPASHFALSSSFRAFVSEATVLEYHFFVPSPIDQEQKRATELPRGLQPIRSIDICFSRLYILSKDLSYVPLEHIKSSRQCHKSSLRYASKRFRWCLFLVRKVTILTVLR